jgi:DNA-binding PucR family transcriptional regulator
MSEFAEAKKLLESTGHRVVKESSPDYHFEKIMKITELLYDNIEELNYDDARDIAEYISEKMESLDVDREYIAETLEQMLDDCGVRISFDLSSRLASMIISL